MRWFRSVVEGAGLAKYGSGPVSAILTLVAAIAGFAVYEFFHVPALGGFIFLGCLALEFESLTTLAKSRRRELAKLWPEVLDSIHSAISSGMSLADAFDDLATSGPGRLRVHFQLLSDRLDAGWGFDESIDELKSNLGEVHADRLCEVLRLVAATGSEALGFALRQQAHSLRRDLAIAGQLESKQGWVAGTAKIAVAAPWIVVALLSSRPENSLTYNSAEGAAILTLGFVVCLVAYRLVHLLGALPVQPRVFGA